MGARVLLCQHWPPWKTMDPSRHLLQRVQKQEYTLGESQNGVLLAYLDFARAIDRNLHDHGPL